MRKYKSEKQFNIEVVDFLKDKIDKENLHGVNVVGGYDSAAPNNYLIRDFTFFKQSDGEWNLYVGSQEIDVIVFKETIKREKLFKRKGNFIKSTGTGIRGNIIVPLAIFELKLAKRQPTSKLSSFPSHDAIAANVITGDIKRLFPNVRAYFLFDNFEGINKPEENISFLRMLSNFDKVFLNWEKQKETLWQDLKDNILSGETKTFKTSKSNE